MTNVIGMTIPFVKADLALTTYRPVGMFAAHDRQGASRCHRSRPTSGSTRPGLEAAEFYVSIFPNSKITNVTHYGEAGPREAGTVLTVDFVLDGQPYTAINGGPEFTFNEAVSLLVNCDAQDEVDYYWDKLREGGGRKSQCGWLKDRFGLSWQVFPTARRRAARRPRPGARPTGDEGDVRDEEDRPRRPARRRRRRRDVADAAATVDEPPVASPAARRGRACSTPPCR